LNVKESRYPNNERKADKRDLEKKLYDQIQETLHCKEEIRSLNSDVKSLDKELTQERNAILLKNKSWKRRFAS
jgi:sugar diacid utilization regulator